MVSWRHEYTEWSYFSIKDCILPSWHERIPRWQSRIDNAGGGSVRLIIATLSCGPFVKVEYINCQTCFFVQQLFSKGKTKCSMVSVCVVSCLSPTVSVKTAVYVEWPSKETILSMQFTEVRFIDVCVFGRVSLFASHFCDTGGSAQGSSLSLRLIFLDRLWSFEVTWGG